MSSFVLPRRLIFLPTAALAAFCLFALRLPAQKPASLEVPVALEVPAHMNDDAAAVWLAMRCAEDGAKGRPALVAALDRMGWGVKDREGTLLRGPKLATPTGLAMRDYEIEMLFWNHEDQPGIRLIAYAQALTVVLPTADAEELAQGLLDSIRTGAESANPQRRFWARFIIALGMTQCGSDLTGLGDPHVIEPDASEMEALIPSMDEPPDGDEEEDDASQMRRAMAAVGAMMQSKNFNMAAWIAAATPKSAWPLDDPVLGPSPAPASGAAPSKSSAASKPATPEERMVVLEDEMQGLFEALESVDPKKVEAAQRRMTVLQQEMANLTQAMQASNYARLSGAMQTDADDDESDEDQSAATRDSSPSTARHRFHSCKPCCLRGSWWPT